MPPWTLKRWFALSFLPVLFVMGILDTTLMSPLAADGQDALGHLIRAKSLKCYFGPGNVGNWKSGTLKLEKDAFNVTTHFDSIDYKAGEARVIGNGGAGDVTVFLSVYGATFIERTDTGNFAFTTVFSEYKKGTREFAAVTSRHMMLLIYPIPSQYHGTCQVWE